MHPDWVGHSGMTGVHFGLVPCLGLWLLGGIACDKSSLGAALNLDTSSDLLTKSDSKAHSSWCESEPPTSLYSY